MIASSDVQVKWLFGEEDGRWLLVCLSAMLVQLIMAEGSVLCGAGVVL